MANKVHTILVVPVTVTVLQACTALTEREHEQIAYDLNEARSTYEERRQACHDSNGSMVTETLTGAKRLSISEMKWAYCRW